MAGSLRERLYLKAPAVITWLGQPEGKEFLAYLQDLRSYNEKQLRETDDDKMLYRAQGAVKSLTGLIDLEQDLKDYLKAVREGKVQKVGTVEVTNGVVQEGRRS